ncbi:DEAD-box ATP-dependent RNA helicase 17-like [Chenopodium quinoa]|uniref:DEAD-box ATP-dependent RNA helicase 17-like n=1 Tax=Chenopodium quinoa TaxID=63459 RepID=UPI000B77C31E|nr:DEAD-box ATP-dependent RNA helicase 17-like [Chenopodium quinoa]
MNTEYSVISFTGIIKGKHSTNFDFFEKRNLKPQLSRYSLVGVKPPESHSAIPINPLPLHCIHSHIQFQPPLKNILNTKMKITEKTPKQQQPKTKTMKITQKISKQQQPKTTKMEVTQKTPKQQQPKTSDNIFASCSFSSLGLESSLCNQLQERLGFEKPTQVQAKAIPVILSGCHVLVNAATGTGKTIAYLAPIIHHLQAYQPRIQRADGTFALVLVPTHELCTQVYETLQKLLHRFHWIVPGYLMGGENRSKEKARLRKGISILVATPGRLLDHLKNTSSFLYSNLRWLIFDEADRILEMGFGKAIEEILDHFGSRQSGSNDKESGNSRKFEFQRQNLLLSATLNDKVNHLANISLENPVMIGLDERELHQNSSSKHLGSEDEAEHIEKVKDFNEDYNLPSQLTQKYVKVPCGSRLAVLLSVLKNLIEGQATQKVVVFFSTCDAVDFHYELFKEFQWLPNFAKETKEKKLFLNWEIFHLHGNMENNERKTTVSSFKAKKSALLLCSDVIARGLDVPEITCIIQYDPPGEATEYVHRVGRTARLGQKGDSLLFLQPIEYDYLQELEKHGALLTEYPLQKVLDSFPLYGQKHFSRKFVSIEMHPWLIGLQKALEGFITSQSKLKTMAQDSFVSWIRGYTTRRGELRKIFVRQKLHLGHVAKSFALKDQPSLVGKSVHNQIKKRKKGELIKKKKKEQIKKRKKIEEKLTGVTGQRKKRRVTVNT